MLSMEGTACDAADSAQRRVGVQLAASYQHYHENPAIR
jgi:hypothetical protein